MTGVAAFLLLLLASCQVFEYSPYVVPHEGAGTKVETHHNLHKLVQPEDPAAPFKFAVIADIQRRFDELAESVNRINADTAVRFVLVAGDMTQFGLNREYVWVDRELDRLKVPWFTVIGNHDALGNGPDVYRQRYGPLDYTFDYGNARFIVANTNGWEFPRTKVPDFVWLETELERAVADSMRIFVLSHVSPYVHQLSDTQSETFTRLMVDHGVEMSIHGHMHSHDFGRLHDSALVTLLVDNIGARNFALLSVVDTGTIHQRIFF